TALITLLTFRAGSITDVSPALLATVLPGVFILPFFLFSATCGQIADKYDRAMLARLSKVIEIAVMGLGAIGFIAASLPAL
ncbi:UNVERIFIED_CONTAM: glycerol acyltransferase, partial [Salmonella enterica subsp. enterica serovar Weltevreden]